MYIYIHIHICVFICSCIYVHMYMCACVHMFIYMHTFICIYVFMFMCKYVCMYICICVCMYMGFPGGSAGKESACNPGDLGLIPGLGASPGEGKGYAFQYSGLENSMDCIVHGVSKSQTQLSNFHFT